MEGKYFAWGKLEMNVKIVGLKILIENYKKTIPRIKGKLKIKNLSNYLSMKYLSSKQVDFQYAARS